MELINDPERSSMTGHFGKLVIDQYSVHSVCFTTFWINFSKNIPDEPIRFSV